MTPPTLGALLYSYFEDYLKGQKGLSPATVSSYRDALRLFLSFVAKKRRCRLTRITLGDLTAMRVGDFLAALETERGNHIRSRNQRLTALKSFFDYLASRVPEVWAEAERVMAIPSKRVPPPRTFYLERDEINALFTGLPRKGKLALRDRAMLMFLYNTGARVQEVADLKISNLELDRRRVHLHGKGDKWRVCPLWDETIALLQQLVNNGANGDGDRPLFTSQRGHALTRFGIYKIVQRHCKRLTRADANDQRPQPSPHLIRHTTAVHLLESGVEVNVIRAWLGHASLETTNRYAEINIALKEQALRACTPPTSTTPACHGKTIWRDDPALLAWLQSL